MMIQPLSSLQKDTACTDRATRYCANVRCRLVWRRRSESGTGAAGGDNARNTTAAVPDEAAAPAGAMRKVNRTQEKPKAASERDLPRCVCETSSGKFKTQIRLCGKLRYIGCFDAPDQASAAYLSVKNDLADVNLSAFSAGQVNTAFDAAKKKALEAGGLIPRKRRPRHTCTV